MVRRGEQMATRAFRGEIENKVDAKGRVSVPADFRRIIEKEDSAKKEGECTSFTIVYGDDRLNCLKCYTERAIGELDDCIKSLDRSSEKRKFLEFFFQTKSFRAQLDPSGRLVIPPKLRAKIKLASVASFAGTGDTFEIWNPDAYRDNSEKLQEMFREGPQAKDPMAFLDEVR